jgi:23S rRNA (uridine2552-2'-O)-methyltransferase
MIRKTTSRPHWRQNQEEDVYVRQARERGYRSRAVFKLIEIDRRYRLFKPGMTVVDLGATPGSWSQYAVQEVGPSGRVIATDILPLEPLEGVEFLQGDLHDGAVITHLQALLGNQSADIVLCDMAPNLSGMASVDQPRAMALAELALELINDTLTPQGVCLIKLFQGQDFETFVSDVRRVFTTLRLVKPKASRPQSREVYLLGLGRVQIRTLLGRKGHNYTE